MHFVHNLSVGLCLLALVAATPNPIAETSLGKVKGSIMTSRKGQDFNAFRGIKFAEAPIGDRRFQPPIAVTKWPAILNATEDGPFCPQKFLKDDQMSEDCLILNVCTRNLTAKRPVIVYIHGGLNVRGGCHSKKNAGPELLMDADIVFVSINFRLDALGHLTTRTKDAPGNCAYLDQVMALKWVQDHISNFGGNPDSVTILGISTGALDVTLHLASPLSSGLFHRAIVMSGAMGNQLYTDNFRYTRQLARQTSCPMYNPPDVVSCLRNVPWQDLVNVTITWKYFYPQPRSWSYEIDGHFLVEDPTITFVEGRFKKVPILIGSTKDEYDRLFNDFSHRTDLYNDIDLNFDKYGQDLFFYAPVPNRDIAGPVRAFYFNNRPITNDTESLRSLGQIYSDILVLRGTHLVMDSARKFVDVYYYRFDYNATCNEGDIWGAEHACDMKFFLRLTWNKVEPSTFMIERIVGWFSSFAENGSPKSVDNVKWLPCNRTHVNVMYNDVDVRIGGEFYVDRTKLWDSLYPVAVSGTVSKFNSGGVIIFWAVICYSIAMFFSQCVLK